MMELVGVLAFLVASLAWTFVGWRCWTGRWRFWLNTRVTFLEAWWPLGFLLGGVLSVLALGIVLAYLGETVVDPGSGLRSTLVPVLGVLLVGPVLVGIPLLVAAGNLMFIEDTYRKKPDGTRTSRLLLPRWYHRELQRRVATTPDRRAHGARRADPLARRTDPLAPPDAHPGRPPGPGPSTPPPPPPGPTRD